MNNPPSPPWQEPNLRIVRGDVLRTDVDAILRDMVQQQRGAMQQERADVDAALREMAVQQGGIGAAAAAAAVVPGPGAGEVGPSGSSSSRGGAKVKVVANLPYNITKE